MTLLDESQLLRQTAQDAALSRGGRGLSHTANSRSTVVFPLLGTTLLTWCQPQKALHGAILVSRVPHMTWTAT